MSEWINVKDRNPDKSGRYLVYEKYSMGKWIGICALRDGGWDSRNITHWMELPKPPSDDEINYKVEL